MNAFLIQRPIRAACDGERTEGGDDGMIMREQSVESIRMTGADQANCLEVAGLTPSTIGSRGRMEGKQDNGEGIVACAKVPDHTGGTTQPMVVHEEEDADVDDAGNDVEEGRAHVARRNCEGSTKCGELTLRGAIRPPARAIGPAAGAAAWGEVVPELVPKLHGDVDNPLVWGPAIDHGSDVERSKGRNLLGGMCERRQQLAEGHEISRILRRHQAQQHRTNSAAAVPNDVHSLDAVS